MLTWEPFSEWRLCLSVSLNRGRSCLIRPCFCLDQSLLVYNICRWTRQSMRCPLCPFSMRVKSVFGTKEIVELFIVTFWLWMWQTWDRVLGLRDLVCFVSVEKFVVHSSFVSRSDRFWWRPSGFVLCPLWSRFRIKRSTSMRSVPAPCLRTFWLLHVLSCPVCRASFTWTQTLLLFPVIVWRP